jgi:DNA processing protein
MSAIERAEAPRACARCLRRSWLLGELSVPLEYQSRRAGRLVELLGLEDEELVRALGGRRRAQLKTRHAQFDPAELRRADGVEAVCRHDGRYPATLTGRWAPPMLNVAGGVSRLAELAAAPVVAIVGSVGPTDYGMEMARGLARGLAASGVTVTSGLTDGISVAAHAGAQEVDGRTIAVMSGGLDVACPAGRRSLYARVRRGGCAVAEVPCGCATRRWGVAASDRIVAGLAQLTVVVEADERPSELACAGIARALKKAVAAVPGRVTSRSSAGAHVLLMEGAHLVRGPADAVELVCGTGVPAEANEPTGLEPRLRATLERVGTGRDTPEKLTTDGEDAGEVLLALSELEVMGMLARGDGGRYVPRNVQVELGSPPATVSRPAPRHRRSRASLARRTTGS